MLIDVKKIHYIIIMYIIDVDVKKIHYIIIMYIIDVYVKKIHYIIIMYNNYYIIRPSIALMIKWFVGSIWLT